MKTIDWGEAIGEACLKYEIIVEGEKQAIIKRWERMLYKVDGILRIMVEFRLKHLTDEIR